MSFDFSSIRAITSTAFEAAAEKTLGKRAESVQAEMDRLGKYSHIARETYNNVLNNVHIENFGSGIASGSVFTNSLISSMIVGTSKSANNRKELKYNPFIAMQNAEAVGSVPGGVLQYPLRGKGDVGPYMKIQGFKYSYDDKNKFGNKHVSSAEKVERTACIILPLPASLQQSTTIGWTDYNSVFAKLVTAAKKAEVGWDNAGQMAEAIKSKLGNEDAISDSVKVAGLAAGTALVSGGGNIISAGLGEGFDFLRMQGGLSVNRMTQAAYSGVDTKVHDFSFTMIPRNAKESLEVKKIIEMFEYCSMGEMTDDWGGLLTNFPSLWNITFHGADGRVINGMLEIPDSVLTNVGVTYGGAGASFKVAAGTSDSFMTSLTLTFKESQNMVRDDLSYIRQGGSVLSDIHPETQDSAFDADDAISRIVKGIDSSGTTGDAD